LVVKLGSDGQRLLVEVPDLGVSTIWSLDDHVSVVDEIKVSVGCHLGNNMERSFNVETEVWVEFSLLWILWVFISIDEIPLLVETVLSLFHSEELALVVLVVLDCDDQASLIDDVMALVSEQLPPSRVDC
jgi:hypothetical protein